MGSIMMASVECNIDTPQRPRRRLLVDMSSAQPTRHRSGVPGSSLQCKIAPPLCLISLGLPRLRHQTFLQGSGPNHRRAVRQARRSDLPMPTLPFTTPRKCSTVGWLSLLRRPRLLFTAVDLQKAYADIRWKACSNRLAPWNQLAHPLLQVEDVAQDPGTVGTSTPPTTE
jgi:hypothetical protein